jgi:hypothetical protein
MNKSARQHYAERVVQFYENNGRDIELVVKHFKEEGKLRKNIIPIIKRYLKNGNITYKKPSGRPPTVSTSVNINKVVRKFRQNPNTSVRIVSQQLKLARSTVSRIKLKKNIRGFRKQKAPKYQNGQEKRAKSCCKKLYRELLVNKVILMDDETYVYSDPQQIPGLEFYHCDNKENVPDENRFKEKEKYAHKFMVWQCIDEMGHVSEPFIKEGTITGDTYLEECLKKRLLPFISKHHSLENIVFWMDLATPHYKKECVQWLRDTKIQFIEKKDNPPNVPQARPIENYWALCKQEYKKLKNAPKDINSFKKKWTTISNKVAKQHVKNVMKGIRTKVKLISTKGVRAPLKQRL